MRLDLLDQEDSQDLLDLLDPLVQVDNLVLLDQEEKLDLGVNQELPEHQV